MRLRRKFRSKRGQSVVEFALILPVIMFLLLGMIELGFAINHNTSIVTATRQGARVGSELVDGYRKCRLTDDTTSQSVDTQIVAAVEGALVSPGSPVAVTQVTKIEIFQYDTDHATRVAGKVNTWVKAVDAYGAPNGTPIPNTTQKLYFKSNDATPPPWRAYTRCGSATAQSIGVSITYTYKFITPLGGLITAFASGQLTISDQTIMAMEPPT